MLIISNRTGDNSFICTLAAQQGYVNIVEKQFKVTIYIHTQYKIYTSTKIKLKHKNINGEKKIAKNGSTAVNDFAGKNESVIVIFWLTG